MSARRDFKTMEQRRFRALRLLEKGLSQVEFARPTKVSRPSVLRWNQQRLEGGKGALRAAAVAKNHTSFPRSSATKFSPFAHTELPGLTLRPCEDESFLS